MTTTPDKSTQVAADFRSPGEIDAEIRLRARNISFGEELAAAGITTIALDGEGNLTTIRPDGTTMPTTTDRSV